MTQEQLGILLKIVADTKDGQAAIRQFSNSLGNIPGQTKKVQSGFQRLNTSVKNFSSSTAVQMGMAGALGAVVAFTGKSIVAFAEFEDKMIDVQKTTGMSNEQIANMGEAIRKMAVDDLQGIVAAETLAGIAEQAGQMGTRGTENILAFTKAIAQIDVATDLTAAQAAEGLGSLKASFQSQLEAMGKSFESFASNIGSAMNALSAENNATVGDILEVTRRIAGASSTIGLSIDQVAGLAATIKNSGIDIEVGGTAMTKFMLKLVEDSDNMAEEFGLNAQELATALKTEPINAVQLVLEAMGELAKAEGPGALSRALNETVGADTRLKDALLKLSQATADLNENLTLSATAFQQNISLQDEFANKAESNISKWTGIGEKIKEIMRGIGQELDPLTKRFTDWTSNSLSVIIDAARAWRGGIREEFFDGVVADFQNFAAAITEIFQDITEKAAQMWEVITNPGKIKEAADAVNEAKEAGAALASQQAANNEILSQYVRTTAQAADVSDSYAAALDRMRSGVQEVDQSLEGKSLTPALARYKTAADAGELATQLLSAALETQEQRVAAADVSFQKFTGTLATAKDIPSSYLTNPDIVKQILDLLYSPAGGNAFRAGGPGISYFHQGGLVQKKPRIQSFHSGSGLRSDDVPAILQTGEMVLSRNQVNAAQSRPIVNNYYITGQVIDRTAFDSFVRQITDTQKRQAKLRV